MSASAGPALNRAVLARRGELISGLQALLTEGRIIDGEMGCEVYAGDAFSGHRAVPFAVAIPANSREVSSIMRFCFEAGLKVYPRGAGTSLTGGAIASEDGIVLSLSRMNRVLELDAQDRLVKVEAGIAGSEISRAAAGLGLMYAPDPASRLASTIGGNIATNASGARSGRYGQTAQHVLATKVVLVDGEVIEFGSGEEEASGYALGGLFVGAEAQLGVIVEATLRLLPVSAARRLLLLGFQSVPAAIACAGGLAASRLQCSATELIDRQVVTACTEFANLDLPDDAEALLFVEFEGEPSELDAVRDQIIGVADGYGPSGWVEQGEPKNMERIWWACQGAFAALGRYGDLRCVDFSVPPRHLAQAMAAVGDIASRYQLRGANLCRTGEGTVRSVLFEEPDDNAMRMAQAMTDIANMVVGMGGQIAAEHGIGVAKRELMRLQLETAELNLHRRLKSAFDSEWLLNHSKVYPPVQDGNGSDQVQPE